MTKSFTALLQDLVIQLVPECFVEVGAGTDCKGHYSDYQHNYKMTRIYDYCIERV